MAYRDESGRITIDEAAAGQDIANLCRAGETLRQAAGYLRETAAQAEEFSGGTAAAIIEVAERLAGDVQSSAERAQQAAELIGATVRKYQTIDQALKSNISGF